jgi:UDP-galactopyranose mutase
MESIDYLIIGAGPTGLGAAHRMQQYGVSSFALLEADSKIGGLSASFQDKSGFTWDLGGHVLFSKNKRFCKLIDDVMGDNLLVHNRKARVRVSGQWTGYPFQNHIHQLEPELAERCYRGLLHAKGEGKETHSFQDWMHHCFGSGISQLFMEPYNRKVWAYPLYLMGYQWIKERVSTVPVRKKMFEVSSMPSDSGTWGPNSIFRYPRDGGIGAIFVKIAAQLNDHILLQHEVVGIDLDKQTAKTINGKIYGYKALLNTTPLDRLIKTIIRSDQVDIQAAAAKLEHNSVSVVGIGLDTAGNRTTSWMYFADAECPFYRLTHLHNYSPTITPNGGQQSALLAEVALAEGQHEDEEALVPKVIDGLIATGILNLEDRGKIISTWHTYASHGYPIPTLEREQALSVIQPFLEHYGIYSRGRFGGWKYEVGNMDHSFMQGVEWAERMVTGKEESIYLF